MSNNKALIEQIESLLSAGLKTEFGAETADTNKQLVQLLRAKADEIELKQIRSTCKSDMIVDLPVGPRIRAVLSSNGILTRDDLMQFAGGKKLRRLPGVGIKAFTTLQQVAYEYWGIVID